MTDFDLRGTFYLGDHLDVDVMHAQADRVMAFLIDVERVEGPAVRDAAVSLDAGSRTIEIELVVTADSFIEAHHLADDAVGRAFGDDSAARETSLNLVAS